MTNKLPDYFRYWGKADPKYKGEPKWHPLVYHCLDVAAVASVWWEQSPAVRRAFLSAFNIKKKHIVQLRAWVLFYTALHDMGKFDIRFQLKSPDTLTECWSELDLNDVDTASLIIGGFDHGHAGYAWAAAEYKEWVSDNDENYEVWDTWRPWLAAVTGHHGELSENPEINSPDGEPYVAEQDKGVRRMWVEVICGLFLKPRKLSLSFLPPSCNRPAQLLLAGFCSVSDWIGSNQDYFNYAQSTTNCGDYLTERIRGIKKKRLLRKLGLIRNPSDYTDITALLEPDTSPRGIQVLVDSFPESPGLTLIEAPTGSGKTEAALAYAWRLLERGQADSIIFALPTQATANAMLRRVEAFAGKAFGKGGANIVLAHGKRDLNPDFQRFVQVGTGHTAQGANEGASQCATWLEQSRKRVFLGQIGVCTIDQVLLSVLPVRHKFVRGFGVNKSVLIVDEVHAYDSYMHGLLSEVLHRQQSSGGSAVLLSATLPSATRIAILEAWKSPESTVDDYPLVTYISADTILPMTLPDKHRPEQHTVLVECIPASNVFPDEVLLQRVISAAKAGAQVAFVCNLVDDAQRISKSLRNMLKDAPIPVDVFHARYRFLDRQTKENAVMRFYGKNAPRDGGRILVATQVIEQSLDLDFDLMFTQICPVDLLFQRLGRLHRHKQVRPFGFEKPRCVVVTAQDWKYGLHKEIYGNTRVLWRTESLLQGTKEIVFPEAYRKWIDTVYMRDDWDQEPPEISLEYDAFNAKELFRRDDAKKLTLMSMSQFRDEDDRITSLTRDSEMSLTLVPVQNGGRLLDGTSMKGLNEGVLLETLTLNSIPVPAGWDKHLYGCERDEDGRYFLEMVFDGSVWLYRRGNYEFSYTSDFGLERRKE